MKGLRFPLWLICDTAAALRLVLATCMLSLHVRLYWPKHATRPPSAEGIACISVGLACCEALLRWAILRQAFRACGRHPGAVRFVRLPPPASSLSWLARCRTFMRLLRNMTLYARRWAKRIKTAMARAPSGVPAQPVVAPSLRRFSRFAPTLVSPPAGQRIRAPPWRLANPGNTSPAPC